MSRRIIGLRFFEGEEEGSKENTRKITRGRKGGRRGSRFRGGKAKGREGIPWEKIFFGVFVFWFKLCLRVY